MAARRRVRAKPERTGPSRPAEESDEEKLRRANLPKELSARYHPFYEGKVEIIPKVPIRGLEDFAIWYTPGVAEACLQIKADPQQVWRLTNKWNNVAIVTDGTRVLGLEHPDREGPQYRGGEAGEHDPRGFEGDPLSAPGGYREEEGRVPREVGARPDHEFRRPGRRDPGSDEGLRRRDCSFETGAWRDPERVGPFDGGRCDPLRDREPRAGDLALGGEGGGGAGRRDRALRLSQSGQQQPRVPGDLPGDTGRAGEDDLRRDVHRCCEGARGGRRGRGAQRRAHCPDDGGDRGVREGGRGGRSQGDGPGPRPRQEVS